MPLRFIHCEVDPEDLVPLDECVACAEGPVPRNGARCHFTGSLLRALYSQHEGREEAGVSASQLTGCLRKVALEAAEDYASMPSLLWPSYRGTHFHKIPEAHHAPHLIVEVRFRKEYAPGQFLTGKLDEFDPTMQHLTDYKSGGRPPQQRDIILGGFKESWVYQLGIYAWLLDGGVRMDTGETVSFPVEHASIVHLDMGAVTHFTVPLLPLAMIHDYILEQATPIQQALTALEHEEKVIWPPRKYTPGKDKLCEWCGVSAACVAIG